MFYHGTKTVRKPPFKKHRILMVYAHLGRCELVCVVFLGRMRLIWQLSFVLQALALSEFSIKYAHPLSVIKRYKELTEIKSVLRECMDLADNDYEFENYCLKTVFNHDYFWL